MLFCFKEDMRLFVKKFIILGIIFSLALAPVCAKSKMKMYGNINDEFSVKNQDLPEEIYFVTKISKEVKNGITVPEGSLVTVRPIGAIRELRWHVSGCILCKLKSYQTSEDEEPVNLSEDNIYIVIRKYEALDKKDAAILTTEIIITQAAGIVGSCFIVFAPVDIAYFFTKGAITKYKNENRFKAGASCAYDNSIGWFWLKGKPIELEENGTISAKEITPKKAKRLERKIKKRYLKDIKELSKRNAKIDKTSAKRIYKYAKKEVPCSVIEHAIDRELEDI